MWTQIRGVVGVGGGGCSRLYRSGEMGAKKVQEKERVVKGLINIRSTGEGYYIRIKQLFRLLRSTFGRISIRDNKYFTAC